MKSLSTTMKTLRIFRKLSRRSIVTRPYRECSCERLSKRQRRGNSQQRTRGTSVQRCLSPILPLKWRITDRKLSQTHGVTIKLVHPFLTRIWSSPRSCQGS
jgi:DMSO/TMAO reductase YedYZ molybdopterin-dependent catalytic subunit